MRFAYEYLFSLWNLWFWLAGGLLTVNEVAKFFTRRSWEWPRHNRGKTAVGLLIIAQIGAYHSLLIQSDKRVADANSAADSRVRQAEDVAKDHERTINDRDKTITELRNLLDNRKARQDLIGPLGVLARQLTNLRNMCGKVTPKEYFDLATKLVRGGVDRLEKAGMSDDARRLADGKMPPGGAFGNRDCSPYDQNVNVAHGLQARIAVLDDVIDFLRR